MRKLALAFFLLAVLHSATFAQMVSVFPSPQGAQPNAIANSTTGTTGQIISTLAGAVGKFTYICGFVLSSGGTTVATTVNATVSGVINGPLNFAYVYPSAGQGILGVSLPGCISSSAQNTSIIVTLPGGGAGTINANTSWGYTN